MLLPAPPRYGTADVSLLLPEAAAAVTGREQPLLGLPTGIRRVILLVVDGLGARQLAAHAAIAPVLSGARHAVLDAVYPTTTATNLTSIGTGLPPGEHGLVSYSLAVPDDDRPLITLTWSWQRQDLDLDARDTVVPERFQPRPTAFERATAAGIRAVRVLRPEFTTSGLTRAGLRGGEVRTATGREPTIAAALAAAAEQDTPTIVYAHHGDLDAIGHLTGPGSEPWCEELAAVDAAVADAAEHLGPDTALLVTADHGMVRVAEQGFVELADDPAWLDGVRVLTGDGRCRQLHVHPGAAQDVLDAWRQRCGEHADVLTREQAITAGWFGPHIADHVRPRIGEVVVSATTDRSWVHRDLDLFGGRLPGQHGALTRDEVEVPLIALIPD